MDNVFISLLFAHFVGDFFLQSKSMAIKKGASNWIAFNHVGIYTFAVLLFTINKGMPISLVLLWIVVIFVPHFIIDRWSLADKWLDLINGRSLRDFLENGHRNIPENINATGYEWDNYLVLRGGFTCIVYVVVDNVSHLACLWYGYNLIFN